MLKNQETQSPMLIKDLGYLYPKEDSKSKVKYGIYQCFCSKEFKAQTCNVKNGCTKSCGCLRGVNHGLGKHRLYRTWNNMIQRCTHEHDPRFLYYGARGITVCEQWLAVENFIKDMYPTFKEGLTLDRIDNNGNYELSNCRWTTKVVQSMNTRMIRTNNKSGYRGVYYDKSISKYRVRINADKKCHYIGIYDSPKDGAIAYNTYIIDNNLDFKLNVISL